MPSEGVSDGIGINLNQDKDEAADSTSSTEPIHLVVQHLRESFSLSKWRQRRTGFY
ncbi:hypothetical protein [Neisseria meningitidis]|uniref:hypothetical protein n=1 Tax=Neisseria meningitidis TaxID=487 RepID=UPI000AD2BC7D|nr:hypothetical protein [Neisseria meningitidis]